MPYAPTLVARPAALPPRVEVTFTSVHALTETATVYRVAGGRQFRVRGAIRIYAAGGFSVLDSEAPFNTEVEYRAEMFTVAGLTLGFTDPATVVLAVDETWIHLPSDPTRCVVVDPRPAFGSSLVEPFNGEMVFPDGRRPGVFIGSGRKGLTDVPLDVATDTFEQADALRSVFGDYDSPSVPVVCIRTQPKWRLPMPLFAAIVAPQERRFNVEFGGETIYWVMSGDEAAPPVEALIIALLTYGDLEASYATYSALEAAYLTYLPMESDYTLAGAV